MFPNATVSSRSSSSRSGGNSCSRNSSMPSLRMRSPLSPKTSYNPLFRHSDAFTSFDASNFVFHDHKRKDVRKESRKNPILRRYNSHDSHTNFGDVRVETKDNTPESTKSRSGCRTSPETSPGSTGDRKVAEFEARDFLERYSLPRVVRVADGEPLLLYRCFDSFTKVQAKGLTGKKGKEKADTHVLHFPEGYCGWFSLTNDKGEKSAVTYSSVLQLVREQVCSFMSVQPFTAYTGHNSDPSEMPGKVQYLKTTVRGGQLFQLRAVFQHRDRPDGSGGRLSTKSSKSSSSRAVRDKDLANRYAQLISQNNQELYVPLTTKGEFYEIHSSMKAKLCFPGLLDKTGPLALDKDCLYKITHLLRRVALPLKVKLLSGPLPPGLPKDFTDTFILERKFQEPLMVTCTLPSPTESAKHEISCINLNSGVNISKCMLGFDSENRLFKSQRLQAALAFCHKNVEAWYREVRLAPNLERQLRSKNQPQNKVKIQVEACEVCLANQSGVCSDCRITTDGLEEDLEQKQLITKEAMEKFPKSKKWYKHFKILGGGDSGGEKPGKEPVEGVEKAKSIERYKDMSKLIEEKFGKKAYNPVKKSASFMFSTKRIDLEETPSTNKGNPALLKCQSLDNQLYVNESKNKGDGKGKKEDKMHFLKRRQLSGDHKLEVRSSKSNISDSLSYDFQMCILSNENGSVENKKEKDGWVVRKDDDVRESYDVKKNYDVKMNFDVKKNYDDKKNYDVKKNYDAKKISMVQSENQLTRSVMSTNLQITDIDFDEIKPVDDAKPLRKTKPDLIPTLTKDSYITERLCSEFHVKTKVQKRGLAKNMNDKMRGSCRFEYSLSIFDVGMGQEDGGEFQNSGSVNSGSVNSGNFKNSGNINSGNINFGYMNSGNTNSGNMNSGNMNFGNINSGNVNSGNMNFGNMNSGNINSGNMNSGDFMNSGSMNSGSMSSGDFKNSGHMNSGNMNSGKMNSGNMNSGDFKNSGGLKFEVSRQSSIENVKSVKVQVHEISKAKLHTFKTNLEIDDIPYSQVADEVSQKASGKKSPDENIYAEICENACNTCDSNKLCECKRTKKEHAEYCYVKLGSNGDSVTSDSDEAIYNTLR